LGAGIAAFRNNLREGHARPRVFVVPCTCTYPLVLEASTLVEDYLSHEGKSHYIIVQDEFSRARRWLDFLGGLLDVDLRIHVRVGAALDPIGNRVDPSGVSRDPHGRPTDPARYLMVEGVVTDDPARDAEYTRLLARRILETYRRDNVALATSVVSFALLELLRRDSRQPDLFRFLRELGPESARPRAAVEAEVDALVAELRALAAAGRIQLDPLVRTGPARALVEQAARTLATYHPAPALALRGESVRVGDADLLFFYRNRLDGYGLRGAPPLVPARGEP
jgi:glycerol-3-phosphate O-acyltransferase